MPRLVLRPFTDMDRAPFHALSTHRAVVESLGRSPTRVQSDHFVDASARQRDRPPGIRAKSDPSDAQVLADLVRTDRHNPRRCLASGEGVKLLARAHRERYPEPSAPTQIVTWSAIGPMTTFNAQSPNSRRSCH